MKDVKFDVKELPSPKDLAKIVHKMSQGVGKRRMYDEVVEGMKKLKNDKVNNPLHYTSGGIETIDYQEAKSTPEEFRGHLRLTALKYLSRAGLKDDTLEDLKKAQWYVNRLIEFIERGEDGI